MGKAFNLQQECRVEGLPQNTFRFDGDYIVCDCYNSSFAPFRAKRAEIRVKLSDEMEVEITDNGQVTDETVFL